MSRRVRTKMVNRMIRCGKRRDPKPRPLFDLGPLEERRPKAAAPRRPARDRNDQT